MLYEEFIKLLRQYKQQYGWIKNQKELLPIHTFCNALYGSLDGYICCPLTFVAGIRNKSCYGIVKFIEAGDDLGLDRELTLKIANAANGIGLYDADIRRDLELALLDQFPLTIVTQTQQ